tara:strand:+ start:13777 stop:14784 length:1008 start_codon:yes stop_codon:yes gene_type:complete
MTDSINCPKCNTTITINLDTIKLRYYDELKQQAEEETSLQIKILQKEVQEKSELIKEANGYKAENEELKRKLDEQISFQHAECERQLTELRNKLNSEHAIEIQAKKETLNKISSELKKALTTAEQTTSKISGNAQELKIFEWLKDNFKNDEIEKIKPGQRGADILQSIYTKEKVFFGKIYYESKNAEKFESKWLTKLTEDMKVKSADIGVLITKDYNQQTRMQDGIWICHYNDFQILATILRLNIINQYKEAILSEDKTNKQEHLYNLLTDKKIQEIVAVISNEFKKLKEDLENEKKYMTKKWDDREKYIDKIVQNTNDIKGLISDITNVNIPDL